MEFRSDPPPSNLTPPSNYAPPSNMVPASYAAQMVASNFNHPSYEQMIRSAIVALNERDGSSRQAIAKFIENEFRIANSPQHSWELTQQLRRMKNSGQLVLVKHSYMLAESVSATNATNYNNLNPVQAQSEAQVQEAQAQAQVPDGFKRRPGRPPKLQPIGGAIASSASPQPVGFTAAGIQPLGEPTIGVPTTNLFGGLTSGALQFGQGQVMGAVSAAPVSNVPTMGHTGGILNNVGPLSNPSDLPGQPPNVGTLITGAEPESVGPPVITAGEDYAAQNNGPPTAVEQPSMELGKRRRGRPAKFNTMVMSAPTGNAGPNPKFLGTGIRGRPGKFAVSTTARRRGRPRKNDVGAIVAAAADGADGVGGVLPVAKKPRKLGGKPLGRPKKNTSETASLTSEIQLMAYQGLKARVEHYQARIKTAVNIVKPYLNETAIIALGALQDLAELADMDIISVPVNVQSAPENVQSAPENVQSAPVDLNEPVNVQGSASENIQPTPLTTEAAATTIQSAPSMTESVPSTLQSAPSTTESVPLTLQSAPLGVQGQQEPAPQS